MIPTPGRTVAASCPNIDSDTHDSFSCSLLPLEVGQVTDLWNISPTTLVDLLHGKYREFDHVYIIDCRFSYEYEGGHIRNAINITDPITLEDFFFRTSRPSGDRVAIVFHCEFSSKRGPALCRHLRNYDRAMHSDDYPNLSYGQRFLLDGGYKEFFTAFPVHIILWR